MGDDLFYRDIDTVVAEVCFDDELRVGEVDRKIGIRGPDLATENEKGSTKCRPQNPYAIRFHSGHDSTIRVGRIRDAIKIRDGLSSFPIRRGLGQLQ
jgi:hypothetical protein